MATKQKFICQNCHYVVKPSDNVEIRDLFSRVEVGDPMPYGECPKCGCLVYPEEPKKIVFVEVSGGVVQDITATFPDADVRLIDYDHLEGAITPAEKNIASIKSMKKTEKMLAQLRKEKRLHEVVNFC
jgi:hypothetical protein